MHERSVEIGTIDNSENEGSTKYWHSAPKGSLSINRKLKTTRSLGINRNLATKGSLGINRNLVRTINLVNS